MVELRLENYPEKLRNIKNAPKRLFAEGDISLLEQKAIAIVGSRKASKYGKDMAKKFSQELTEAKIIIASGLAIGIDEKAHETCIENGGKTIAILGSGIKNIYPSENAKLANIIIKKGGLILSEYEPKEEAKPANFPKRNRILSAISEAVLVIEASHRSGSKITARYAIEQGKKLYLISPNLESKNIAGVKELFEKGGKIVFSAKQIIEELKIENQIELNEKFNLKLEQIEGLTIKEEKIYKELLKREYMNISKISEKTNMVISEVRQALTMLEIKGIVETYVGNEYKLKEVRQSEYN